ncbi:hypothetical protein [Streptomyces sp. NPDC055085]
MLKVSAYAKAVAAAAAAATGTLVAVTADGALSTGDIVTVVLSVLGALGITYAVPNKTP